MESERATLTHQAVEEECGVLGNAVVLDEELLELVHDQQNPRRALAVRRRLLPVGRDILHAGSAEQFAAPAQFAVESLQDTQAELALALNGHDAGVRQVMGCVSLKLDALLKVDQ